jgi:hypothetical protein
MSTPKATFAHQAGKLDATLEFIKRTRFELRALRKVRVWTDKVHILDINHDIFEITGVGYPDADIVAILQAINTAFDPATIHQAATTDFKEFETGRRYPWARDRVL